MHCATCGNPLNEDSKFCGKCGASVLAEHASASTVEAATLPPQKDYTATAKQTGRQFYRFALQALQEPFRASQRVDGSQRTNGFIALLLLAFLMPFFSYLAARNAARGLWAFGESVPDVFFGVLVLQPFLYQLLFLAVFIAVNLGVGKWMRVEITYMSVMAKYGSLVILPVTGLLAANLFMLLSMNTVGAFFFFVSIALYVTASTALLFSIHSGGEAKGLDVFYGVVMTNVAMAVFFLIVMMSMIDRMIGEMGVPYGW
ncbi:zinc-ribbon domain-containing protein [Halobacillus sp. Cin3]|uniref:zinc-ribbon domain-containing protein n=1 Tax=Halobacillus sp. Cin3 TaxID=2928441 RepID=UPI00248EF3A1|nr:zinc-ribbon domain-containing protein [Halobacillus sp. Cin3]